MTEKEKKEIIKNRLNSEFKFAYSPKKEENLEDALIRNERFKINRLEAERAAMQNFRINNPNNETHLAYLIDKGLIQIWDLREELRLLEEKEEK